MIRIFPLDQIKVSGHDKISIIRKLKDSSNDFILKEIIGDYVFFNNGKDAIKAIIEHLRLKRIDEVFITTTTDSSYVSTCVSATIFNYCGISRILTKRTKAIFVIHTYGFPHPKLGELRNIADNHNIPLIEDCISAFNSYSNDNIRLGSIGDYAVYSLPKIIPIEYGGILTSKTKVIKGISDDYLSKELKFWTPFLNEMKNRTRKNYFYLKKTLGFPIYQEDKNVNPFMYGLISKDYEIVMEALSGLIEFGKTHVKNEIHIPVNPYIQIDDYKYFVNYKL